MGTVNFTKINFTLLELMHLVGRVEIMNNIMYLKLADVDVCFPRDPVNKLRKSRYKLPSDEETQNALLSASNTAITEAAKFGIHITADEIVECRLKDVEIDLNTVDDNISCEIFDLASNVNHDKMNYRNLRDFPNHHDFLDENSSFVNVIDEKGTKTVRKSSLMNNCSSSKDRLSSDRISHVRGSKNKSSCRQLEFVDVNSLDQPIYKSEQLKIGDWCIFKSPFEVDEDSTNLILGNIISFQYVAKSNTENTDGTLHRL